MATVEIGGFGAPLDASPKVRRVAMAALVDDEIPNDVPRDRYGRPLIMQTDGTLIPYGRVSTISGTATDGHGLGKWRLRHTALSIGRHEDIAGMIAPLEYGDPELDRLIEIAQERSLDMVRKRHHGTAVHGFTALGPDDYRQDFIPVRMKDDVTAYRHELAKSRLTPVESEVFVVNDMLRAAGTFDDIYTDEDTGFFVIGDKKTGAKISPFAVSAQLGLYLGGQRYDWRTGERYPIADELSTDHVAVVHIPAGAGTCQIYKFDAWQAMSDGELCAQMYHRRLVKASLGEWSGNNE